MARRDLVRRVRGIASHRLADPALWTARAVLPRTDEGGPVFRDFAGIGFSMVARPHRRAIGIGESSGRSCGPGFPAPPVGLLVRPSPVGVGSGGQRQLLRHVTARSKPVHTRRHA